MNTPDEVYERVGDALGYGSGDALSPTERLIADVAYHYPGTPDEIRQRDAVVGGAMRVHVDERFSE